MKRTLVTLLLAWVISSPGYSQTISFQGSPVLQGVVRGWAEAYGRKSPDFKLLVQGDGNEAGFAALKAGKADIVSSSRHITYKEVASCQESLGAAPREYKVGVQGVAVYVNASNPVGELTLAELRGIFTGKFANWRRVGGDDEAIRVCVLATNSAASEFFKDLVLEGKEFLPGATVSDQKTLLATVAAGKSVIGFGNLVEGTGVKRVSIKRAVSSTPVDPTEETITDQTYPISGYLYCYLDPKSDQGSRKDFLNWVRSAEGQQVLRPLGFYPLPETLRSK